MAKDAVLEVDEIRDEVLRWIPIAKSVPKTDEDLQYEEIGVYGVKFNAKDSNLLDYFNIMFPGDW